MSNKWVGGVLDYASLYPSQMSSTIKVDIVKVNRQITINNIVNDTDVPLVKSETEAIWYELLQERKRNKEDE